jgi:hypothetical protein
MRPLIGRYPASLPLPRVFEPTGDFDFQHFEFFNSHACLQQHHHFRPVAPSARRFSLRLSTSPSGVSQADFFRGKLNGITFPYSSGGIHFVAFFLKLLGTKNSMIFAINHPACINRTEAKKFSF